ncbi:Alpha/Beta hydrolase protein [Xylariales sp. PMI_506]|nr:Alpha/Beta hydrolase protein [Xylariales sp. PMI_506]
MSRTETRRLQIAPDVIINAVISKPSESTSQQRVQGPSIVFLHYWGGSHKTWSLVNEIVSRDYPTAALDLRGWGDSTGPARADAYSTSDLANDVEAAVAALGKDELPGPIVLVGQSMGAKTAQLLAGRTRTTTTATGASLDGRLGGLVLAGPAPPTPLVLPPEMRDQQVHAYDNEDSARFVAHNVLTARPLDEDTAALLVADMLRGNEWARPAWPAYVMAEDISAQAREIRVPVLVVAGEKDIVEPPEKVKREVADTIPGAQFTVIADSGHLSSIDQPVELANQILGFVQKLHV